METLTIHTINLPRRTDRWERCKAIGSERGVRFERAQTVDLPKRGWIGCSLSHQLVVFEAKLRNDPWVLVAEDDVELTSAFTPERLLSLIEHARVLGIGALYTGTVSYAQEIRAVHPSSGSLIVETDAPMSSHLTCYFARAYDAVLHWPMGFGSDYGQDPAIPGPDQDRMRVQPPIRMARAIVLPFLAIQRDDFSDNVGRTLDLAQHWRDAEQSWQNAVRLGTNRADLAGSAARG